MRSVLKDIGSFNLKSQTMLVSDPCYKPGTWCTGKLKNCVPGKWNAAVRISDEGEWGKRIAVLIVWKDGTAVPFRSLRCRMRTIPAKFQLLDAEIGVDSGQCGFFDETTYYTSAGINPNSPASDEKSEMIWDEACCAITMAKKKAGVTLNGALSSSGYGDGCYPCGYHKNKLGQVDIAFLSYL